MFNGVIFPSTRPPIVQSGAIANTPNSISSGLIASGSVMGQAGGGPYDIASGTLNRFDLSSGCVIDQVIAARAISGMVAVCIVSGTPYSGATFLVAPAERASGLRIPAIGVHVGDVLSGQTTQMVSWGAVTTSNSGVVPSGNIGNYLYLGSGGLIVNLSGFYAGTSSGPGPSAIVGSGLSGTLVQRLGIAISGGILVNPELTPSSGLLSGLLGTY